jgi:hypothetical protein
LTVNADCRRFVIFFAMAVPPHDSGDKVLARVAGVVRQDQWTPSTLVTYAFAWRLAHNTFVGHFAVPYNYLDEQHEPLILQVLTEGDDTYPMINNPRNALMSQFAQEDSILSERRWSREAYLRYFGMEEEPGSCGRTAAPSSVAHDARDGESVLDDGRDGEWNSLPPPSVTTYAWDQTDE